MATLSEKDAHHTDAILAQLESTTPGIALALRTGYLGRAREQAGRMRAELDALDTILRKYED